MVGNDKQVFMAVSGSVLLHLLFLLIWASAIQWLPSPKKATPPPPIHLQIVKTEETPTPTPTPLVEATPTPLPEMHPFIDTADRPSSTPLPKVSALESSQDTEAASELPATGDQPLPTQKGRKSPVFAFDTTAYLPGTPATLAMTTPASTPPLPPTAPSPPVPARAATPSHTPVPDDEFGLPAPTPTPEDAEPSFDPAFRAPASTSPPQPIVASRSANASDAAGFQAEQQATSFSGNINKHGPANVDSAATPMGRYQNVVIHAISAKWYSYFFSRSDVVALGTVRIHLVVDRGGRVLTPRVLSNSSNEALANVSLQAVMDAPIPPMPPDAVTVMKGGVMAMDVTFNAEE